MCRGTVRCMRLQAAHCCWEHSTWKGGSIGSAQACATLQQLPLFLSPRHLWQQLPVQMVPLPTETPPQSHRQSWMYTA